MSQIRKFFYVIDQTKQIYEIEYTKERIEAYFNAMKNKGIITVKNSGVVLNGSHIVKILDAEQYENYILTTSPKVYIKNGTWRDKQGVIRHESWKQLQIENAKRKELKVPEKLSKKQKERIDEIRKEIRDKFFIKNETI